MATIPVFSPGKSHWTEEPGGLHSIGVKKESDMTKHSILLIFVIYCTFLTISNVL